MAQRVIGERQAMDRELSHTMWAVDDKATGTFAGQCGLRPADEGAGKSTSPTTTPGPPGTRDTAPRRLSPCSPHGLGPIGLDTIMAVAVPENAGSWRVMEKAGMRYHGLVDYYGMEGLKKYIAARRAAAGVDKLLILVLAARHHRASPRPGHQQRH